MNPWVKRWLKVLAPIVGGSTLLFGIIKLVVYTDARDAQNAWIRVQYDVSGHAIRCWVTPQDNVSASNSSAIHMTSWRSYEGFAQTLGADPKQCDVWSWDGKK